MTTDTTKKFLSEMHFFISHDVYFIFLPQNLQLFEVDSDTYYEMMDLHKKFGTDKPLESCDDDMLAAGIVYEAECAEEDIFKKRYELEESKGETTSTFIPINSTVLQIANDCNLNCIYCYGDGGSYGRKRELMTFETAKKAAATL